MSSGAWQGQPGWLETKQFLILPQKESHEKRIAAPRRTVRVRYLRRYISLLQQAAPCVSARRPLRRKLAWHFNIGPGTGLMHRACRPPVLRLPDADRQRTAFAQMVPVLRQAAEPAARIALPAQE
ncbi:hypothetical protein GCM10007205_17130 [Oxalicibacterium flavum]|uniref:Uncharacterized protein n=1 Tax=Oxalicibacterium flavum TaxID=179467 RepID=A0A8J2XXB7_9BURK|nr:hypothetical protein GCM10007205_17130 [Oxalicibacterium flavum]